MSVNNGRMPGVKVRFGLIYAEILCKGNKNHRPFGKNGRSYQWNGEK